MKKFILLLIFGFALVATSSLTSCRSAKYGCPANERADPYADRRAPYTQTNTKKKKRKPKPRKLPTKRGKSNLFPKDMRRQ